MSILRTDNFGPSAGGTTRSLRGIAAAWANLNGTGTIALRDSQGVSSVVDGGTGDYRYNFSGAMSNASYSVTEAHQSDNVSGSSSREYYIHTNATGSHRGRILLEGGTSSDLPIISIAVLGDLA